MKKFDNYRKNLDVLRRSDQQDLNNEFIISGIIDKFSIQFAEMQRDTIKETLLAKRMDEGLVERLLALLDECEMARYSREDSEASPENLYNRAIEVISDFENKY